ncbi:MAG TPA: LamG-like jellyroll fold domain-containing protein, partial [Verrucomicrobiae bacterium]|nr:LamG-like jellyroll fold domain-containing protein [Verrucomicrobiae bacterium]
MLTFIALILGSFAARAQVNQLHFVFGDAPGTTTTTSDTNLNTGAIANATLKMFNAAGTGQVDLHGAAGSGINGAATGLRAMDFTSDIVPTQTNQPANSTLAVNSSGNGVVAADLGDAALASGLGSSGTINNFIITIWIKQPTAMLGGSTIGPRVWILNTGTNGVDSGGSANSLGLKFQQANQLYFQLGTDTSTVIGNSPSGNFPTNRWMFFAVTYDGTNAAIYYGTDGSAAQLIGSAATASRSVSLGASASLAIGNRHNATANARGFDGWINDFRFYSGVPTNTLAFVESVRQSLAPKLPLISGVYPDGTALMQATNTITFNAASSSGLNLTNISLVINGVNVSSGLQLTTNGTPGTATNITGTYNNLPQQTTNLAVITATDALGLAGVATVKFDTFSPSNLIIKAEEFDFGGGQWLANPDYTDGNPPDTNSYFGLDSMELIDTHKGATAGDSTATDYRYSDGFGDRTQTPPATGELTLPRLAGLVDANSNAIVNHMVGFWSSAEWQNYTRMFPSGNYNVFARLSTASGSTIHFDQITSGWGTDSQTTANLGSFVFSGASLSTWQWVPLLKNGTLAVVNLAGTNTVRATTGGGANADFYMLVPANTNLPIISAVYPDGQFLFEFTNRLTFTASSAATTIATSNIQVTLNGSNVSAGLAFSGGPSTWNVSYTGLQANQTYNAVIQVRDNNGGTTTATLTMDTWNPLFQVEAEDFDFNPSLSPISNGTGKRYIDNPVPTPPRTVAANSYEAQVGDSLIDEAGPNTANPITSQAGWSLTNYRTNDYTATTIVTDAARRQFAQANALDYNVGFLGPGFWQEYTRTWPSGTFNVYGRMASGANIGTIHSSWQQIVAGWGLTNQVARTVGTFSIPTTGGYSAYLYIPLMDRFGNYAQLTLGGTNTFRALDLTDPGSFGLNINFYMLTAARTDLPRIDNVYPDGSVLMQPSSTFSFVASSPTYGIATSNITVTLNGVNISSGLSFSGSSTSWNVSYSGLQPNTNYTVVVSITDNAQQTHATTVNFDTFNSNNFTWEAEDFDFGPENSPISNGS